MRAAGETPPSPATQRTTRHESPAQTTERAPNTIDEAIRATNNVGTGANTAEVHQPSQPAPAIDVRELMERSNQLAERFNQLLERSNDLSERCTQPVDQPNCQTQPDSFNQVLERFTRLLEPMHRPAEPDQLAERFNQLLDRFNQLAEQSNQPAQTANELSKRANQIAERANQLAELAQKPVERLGDLSNRANQIAERANQLAELAQKPVERLGDVLKNVNKVLVGIQHAIVRNHKGNTASAVDCLVNVEGDTPSVSPVTKWGDFKFFTKFYRSDINHLPVTISGVSQSLYIPDSRLGAFLHFYDVGQDLYEGEMYTVREGEESTARLRLGDYLSCRLG
ncbi:hypothetical protein RSAG8_13122, partial [Rhizoctonia solani AG-8 WAC10335]